MCPLIAAQPRRVGRAYEDKKELFVVVVIDNVYTIIGFHALNTKFKGENL